MVVLIETLNRVVTDHQPPEVGDTIQTKQTKKAERGRQGVSHSNDEGASEANRMTT